MEREICEMAFVGLFVLWIMAAGAVTSLERQDRQEAADERTQVVELARDETAR